jgi:4-diphosphocytidyl-2-C-methyl-D-erythritol kinase
VAQSISLQAAAKLNLGLRVVGRRSDGYHLLQSLVVFLDLADQLGIAPSLAWRLRVSGRFASQAGGGDENLALRAGRMLAREALADIAGCAELAAEISLEKNIPVAAGLGGGSADAAAVMHGLNKAWSLDLPLERLQEIGAQLGADLPMCLAGVPAMVSGVGENIEPMSLPALSLLIVNPGIPLSTKDVFARLEPPFSQELRRPEAMRDVAGVAAFARALGNDLTAPAVGLCPTIAAVLRDIEMLDGSLLAQMSGSGATCFGIFENNDAATRAAAALQNQRPAWFVRACHSQAS